MEEIDRVGGLGFRGITLPIQTPEPYLAEEFDPVWDAAAANGFPVSFHSDTGHTGAPRRPFAGSQGDPRTQQGTKTVSAMRLGNQAFDVAGAVIGAGVLERHPDLHLIFVETGAGWLASAIPAMDFAWAPPPGADRARDIKGVDEGGKEITVSVSQLLGGGWPHPLRPSEYARRQVHATFQDEPAAIDLRHVIGIEQLLWGSDFPHPEGTWPRSQEVVAHLFAQVPSSESQAILGGTMAQLYRIEVPAEP